MISSTPPRSDVPNHYPQSIADSPEAPNTALPPIPKSSNAGNAKPSKANNNQSPDKQPPGPRRSSFGFLRRARSGEQQQQVAGIIEGDTPESSKTRSVSNSRMNKKQKAAQAAAAEEAARREREATAVPIRPPRLPSHSPLPQINSFGGDDSLRPDSLAIVSNRAGFHNNTSSRNQNYRYGQAQSYNNNYSRPSMDHRSSTPHGIPIPPIPGMSPVGKNGEYVDPYARTESMTNRGRYSYASSAVSTLNSPRRVRRRKDPTPFKYVFMIS